MGKIIIDIKNKSKKNIVISLLKELPYIELKELKELKKKSTVSKGSDFRKLFGIWKDREISLRDLREKAWQKGNKIIQSILLILSNKKRKWTF